MLKAKFKDDFKNLLEYRQWVNQVFSNLSEKNNEHVHYYSESYINSRTRDDKHWFGEGATFRQMSEGITEYQSPELIDKIYNQVNDKIETQVKEKIKARKVNYNAQGLGVFVYDRAAMGMYRLKEFFSPVLNKIVEKEEVQNNKGNYELIVDGSPVIERWEEKPDGKPKIRTTSKRVYAYYPKVSKQRQAVEIFISCGGYAGIKAPEFLYSGISALVVAQLLEKARISTRISVVFGSSPDGFRSKAFGCIVPIKNYDETLDTNLLALLSSDPRFFRFEGFKGIVSLYEYFGEAAPLTLGQGMNKDLLKRCIENTDYAQKANLPPNRFYFGWTFNEREAVNDIKTTIEEIATRLNQ